jgi:hypothetical protein
MCRAHRASGGVVGGYKFCYGLGIPNGMGWPEGSAAGFVASLARPGGNITGFIQWLG